MRHPLQEIWDKQKRIAEMIAMIHSCSPFIAKVKDKEIEIIHLLSESDKQKISQLREMEVYCFGISEKYFGRHDDGTVGVESLKIKRSL